MIDTFLFDFDGTIVNSVPGIMATLEKTKACMNVDFDLDYAKSLIGTPLVSMGVQLCGDARAAEFVDVYRREYFKWGADKIYYFDGMQHLLDVLIHLLKSQVSTSHSLFFALHDMDRSSI